MALWLASGVTVASSYRWLGRTCSPAERSSSRSAVVTDAHRITEGLSQIFRRPTKDEIGDLRHLTVCSLTRKTCSLEKTLDRQPPLRAAHPRIAYH